eukprot:TRINITY_DN56341_c0_g1_i1.p2 TRINITY_DN56341_c0_g1~~TRINITY_DN56341_c0_g1_i1.p2  ORF type:complete len:126 (-),score=8.48 TRINITY_DN56341_c0_g1_i1:884-1261(-)
MVGLSQFAASDFPWMVGLNQLVDTDIDVRPSKGGLSVCKPSAGRLGWRFDLLTKSSLTAEVRCRNYCHAGGFATEVDSGDSVATILARFGTPNHRGTEVDGEMGNLLAAPVTLQEMALEQLFAQG